MPKRKRGSGTITKCTINCEIAILRGFFNYAMSKNLIACNPVIESGLKPLKEDDGKQEMIVLELDEIHALEAECDDEWYPAPRLSNH